MKLMKDFQELIEKASSIAYTHLDFKQFLPEEAYEAIEEEDKKTTKKFDLIFIGKAKDSQWAQKKLRKSGGTIIYINKVLKRASKTTKNEKGNRIISLNPRFRELETEVDEIIIDEEDSKKLSDGEWLEAGGTFIYEKKDDDLYHEEKEIGENE